MRNALKFVQSYILIAFIIIIAFNFSFDMAAHYEIREIFKKKRQQTLENELKKLNKKKIKLEKEETLCSKLLSQGAQLIDSPRGAFLSEFLVSGVIGYQLFKNPKDYSFKYGAQIMKGSDIKIYLDKPVFIVRAVVGFVSSIICWKFLEWTLKPYQPGEHHKKALEKDIEKTSKKIEEIKNLK